MKREILFKAKRADNGEWVFGQLVYDAIDMPRIAQKDSSLKGLKFQHANPNTVCQFTGLTDKNGNKIFEGDILRHTVKVDSLKKGQTFENVVDLFTGGTYCGFRIGNGRFRKPLTKNWIFNQEPEIIGNIHD
jgi:uncharacterized phage protein (TIGR01671 family)